MAFYSSYWDKTGDTTTKPDWQSSVNFTPSVSTGPSPSDYWNPAGDKAGYSWSDALKYKPGKGFLDNFVQGLGESGKYQGMMGQSGGGGAAFGGGSSGSGNSQIFPNFSMYDPNAGKNPWVVQGVQGQDSPWKLPAQILGNVASSFAGGFGSGLGSK
jgi:hypothetical protein